MAETANPRLFPAGLLGHRWFLATAFFIALAGCKTKATDSSQGRHISSSPDQAVEVSVAGKPFLDQKKQVPPMAEWTREIASRKGGNISFRITSQGHFAVTVVSERGFKVLQSGRGSPQPEDILLHMETKNPTLDGSVALPQGSSWFIIENKTNNNVEITLQCTAS